MPRFHGIHHVALTVTDLSISEPFYEKVLGSSPVMTMTDGPFTRRVFALPGPCGDGPPHPARRAWGRPVGRDRTER